MTCPIRDCRPRRPAAAAEAAGAAGAGTGAAVAGRTWTTARFLAYDSSGLGLILLILLILLIVDFGHLRISGVSRAARVPGYRNPKYQKNKRKLNPCKNLLQLQPGVALDADGW